LALNEENPEQLAEKYDIATQTCYDIRYKHKSRIAAVLAEWSNEFSDLWAVKKHARVADAVHDLDQLQARMDELKEDAERATETVRNVDPTAGPVRVPLPAWRGLTRDKAKLRDQIMNEMGQNPQHLAALAGERAASARGWLGVQSSKSKVTYPIDLRVGEIGDRLMADSSFVIGVECRHSWLIGEIVAALDPSHVNTAEIELPRRRNQWKPPVDRRIEALRDLLIDAGLVGRLVERLRGVVANAVVGGDGSVHNGTGDFERLSDTDYKRYVQIRDELEVDEKLSRLVGEALELEFVEVLQDRPDWREGPQAVDGEVADPAPVGEPEPVPEPAAEPVQAPEPPQAVDGEVADPAPVGEPEPVPEPAAEPVQAPEPAPVQALEPAPVLAEEPALEPAPEPVEEPEPEARVTSIEDLRGSIVLAPSYREQYAAMTAWG
jgi:hypothetical protein